MAALALWDPVVAERLAALPIEQLLDPRVALAALARERGWTTPNDGGGGPDGHWAAGIRHRFEGQDRLHSAALALGKPREVTRRVWSAQVSVLFPFVEEQRQLLVERLGARLGLPWQTTSGLVTDALDLEVGHLAAGLRGRPGVASTDRRIADALRNVRNHLAHLEPVGVDLLRELQRLTRAPR